MHKFFGIIRLTAVANGPRVAMPEISAQRSAFAAKSVPTRGPLGLRLNEEITPRNFCSGAYRAVQHYTALKSNAVANKTSLTVKPLANVSGKMM